MKPVQVGEIVIGGGELVLIAGPCVIESEEGCLRIARETQRIAETVGLPLIFKASYDKANRTSIASYRGPGRREGLRILQRVKDELGIPVLTDVHETDQVPEVARVVDILQIPAFLCRQTDLLLAAATTGKVVNVKKAQFLSPHDMKHVIAKIESTGSQRILLTERGTTFGYGMLVVDMRSLPIMRGFGYPVVFDATHSVQLPGGGEGKSGGQCEFVPVLTRAAVAAGVDALFLEVHDDPGIALSDGPNMVKLAELPALLQSARDLHLAAHAAR